MKVRIVKCSSHEWWYEDQIGKEYDVERAEFEDWKGRVLCATDDYMVSFGFWAGNFILKTDCEVIEQ